MKKERNILLFLFFLIVSPSSVFAEWGGTATGPLVYSGNCTADTCAAASFTWGGVGVGIVKTTGSLLNGQTYWKPYSFQWLECENEVWVLKDTESGQYTTANPITADPVPVQGEPCEPSCADEYAALEAKCAAMPIQPEGQTIATFDYNTCEGTCTCPPAGTYAGEYPVTCIGPFCADPVFNDDGNGNPVACADNGCEVAEAWGWPIYGDDWANEYNIFFDLDYTGESCENGSVDPQPNDCTGWAAHCAAICASVGDTVFDDTCNSNTRTCQCTTFVSPDAPPGSPPVGFETPEDYEDGKLTPINNPPQDPIDPDPESPPEDPTDDPPTVDPVEDPPGESEDGSNGWLKAIKANTDTMISQNNSIISNTNDTAYNTARTVDALNTSNGYLNNIQGNTSAISTKLNTTNSRLTEISGKLNNFDTSGIESRLDIIHGDVDGVEGRLDTIITNTQAEQSQVDSWSASVESDAESAMSDSSSDVQDFVGNAIDNVQTVGSADVGFFTSLKQSVFPTVPICQDLNLSFQDKELIIPCNKIAPFKQLLAYFFYVCTVLLVVAMVYGELKPTPKQ